MEVLTMSKVCLVFNYDSKEFMNINKILILKNNYKRILEKGIELKFFFYGDASREELATFMGYFNKLSQINICDISVSYRTKELIFENGINNKSIKLTAKNAKEVSNKEFTNIIKEYYGDDIEIRLMPTKGWENTILDVIGE